MQKKEDKKKDEKKQADDEIPMDNAAIKAYSSVIADAAEDSEPAVPVQYAEIKDEARADSRMAHAPAYWEISKHLNLYANTKNNFIKFFELARGIYYDCWNLWASIKSKITNY